MYLLIRQDYNGETSIDFASCLAQAWIKIVFDIDKINKEKEPEWKDFEIVHHSDSYAEFSDGELTIQYYTILPENYRGFKEVVTEVCREIYEKEKGSN